MPATASGPVVPPPRRAIFGCAALLVLAALAAYHNTFRVPFLFDDLPSVVDNPTIRHLGDLGSVLFPNAGHGITVGGRPVLNLSLALCYAVSGTNIWSYHAFNLLIHVLAGLALFGVVRRTLVLIGSREQGARSREEGAQGAQVAGYRSMAGQLNGHGSSTLDLRPRPLPPAPSPLLLGTNATAVAFAVALLWTLHPLQTEAVTYIIQRTESLMGLFVLLTLYCFIRAAEGTRDPKTKGPSDQRTHADGPERSLHPGTGRTGVPSSLGPLVFWSLHLVCPLDSLLPPGRRLQGSGGRGAAARLSL
jgi:hypothetical protein